jgi:DNA repair ATPase RecN
LTDVAALAAEVRQRRRDLDRQAGRAQQVATAGQAAEAEIERLAAQVDLHAKVAALLTSIGEEAQESARAQFEELATQALQSIFGESLSFRLVPGESGGQATLEPVIRSDYNGTVTETPVMDARGGGMVVVVGAILRLVMILLTPTARKIIFLDESFAHVSAVYRQPLARFLREIADRADMQVVMITHDPVYAEYADMQVRFALGPGGVTQAFEGEAE